MPGVPKGVRFSPWQAIGPFKLPAGKDGFDHAYPPEQEIDLSKQYDKLGWKRETRPDGTYHTRHRPARPFVDVLVPHGQRRRRPARSPSTSAATTGPRCGSTASSSAPCPAVPAARPVKLPLEAGENRLLVKFHNITGGKGYSFSLTKNTQDRPSEDNSPEAILWGLVERDFRDVADQRQMRWEREDGIWDADWRAGDFRELADRYAAATRPQASARRQGPRTRRQGEDAGDLDAVRDVYYRSRAIEERGPNGRRDSTSPRCAARSPT